MILTKEQKIIILNGKNHNNLTTIMMIEQISFLKQKQLHIENIVMR